MVINWVAKSPFGRNVTLASLHVSIIRGFPVKFGLLRFLATFLLLLLCVASILYFCRGLTILSVKPLMYGFTCSYGLQFFLLFDYYFFDGIIRIAIIFLNVSHERLLFFLCVYVRCTDLVMSVFVTPCICPEWYLLVCVAFLYTVSWKPFLVMSTFWKRNCFISRLNSILVCMEFTCTKLHSFDFPSGHTWIYRRRSELTVLNLKLHWLWPFLRSIPLINWRLPVTKIIP